MFRSSVQHALIGGLLGGVLGGVKYSLTASNHSSTLSDLEQIMNYVRSKNTREESMAIRDELERLIALEADAKGQPSPTQIKEGYTAYGKVEELTTDGEILQFANTKLQSLVILVEDSINDLVIQPEPIEPIEPID
jgi:hypothetical protein